MLLAGDGSYTQDLMLRGNGRRRRLRRRRRAAHATADPRLRSRDAHRLPAAHDPDTAARLASRQPIGAAREKVIA